MPKTTACLIATALVVSLVGGLVLYTVIVNDLRGPKYGWAADLAADTTTVLGVHPRTEKHFELTEAEADFVMAGVRGPFRECRTWYYDGCYPCRPENYHERGSRSIAFQFYGPNGEYLGYRNVDFYGPPFYGRFGSFAAKYPPEETNNHCEVIAAERAREIARILSLGTGFSEEQVVEMAECADDCPDARGRNDYGAKVNEADREADADRANTDQPKTDRS